MENADELDEKAKASKFRGIRENRFGRIGEIYEAITAQSSLIRKFFDDQVNEHQNKLVLAVSAYISSPWFMLCSRVAAHFYETVTLKLKSAIEIDEFKSQKASTSTNDNSHNWSNTKVALDIIIKDLENQQLQATEENLNGRLFVV